MQVFKLGALLCCSCIALIPVWQLSWTRIALLGSRKHSSSGRRRQWQKKEKQQQELHYRKAANIAAVVEAEGTTHHYRF
jgi:hypothetical protein